MLLKAKQVEWQWKSSNLDIRVAQFRYYDISYIDVMSAVNSFVDRQMV